jgi:hypothetical protein
MNLGKRYFVSFRHRAQIQDDIILISKYLVPLHSVMMLEWLARTIAQTPAPWQVVGWGFSSDLVDVASSDVDQIPTLGR